MTIASIITGYLPQTTNCVYRIDRKRLRQLMDKDILGQKAHDVEE